MVGAWPDGEPLEYAELSGSLNGSGATFPKGFYEEVIWDFRGVAPDLEITYAGGGSGQGKSDLADGVVDWAGSDSLIAEDQLGDYEHGVLYVPTVAAAITVSYHLDGVDDLRLDAETSARIFSGEITSWDHPAIAEQNPDVDLPGTAITVARRSDGSGTTTNFTTWLDEAAPGTWPLGRGDTVDWPADTLGGNGNAGVAFIVQDVPGAIGYVDNSDARAAGLQTAWIRNRAGNYVAPSPASASAAVDAAEVADDLTYDPVDSPGEDAYPIAAPTWVLVAEHQTDAAVAEDLVAWLTFLLTEGQELAEEIHFAPLPDELRQRALDQVAKLLVSDDAAQAGSDGR